MKIKIGLTRYKKITRDSLIVYTDTRDKANREPQILICERGFFLMCIEECRLKWTYRLNMLSSSEKFSDLLGPQLLPLF